MRKTDINKYVGSKNTKKDSKKRSIGRIAGKSLLTVFTILFISGIIVSISLISFILSLRNESIDYDLHKLQLNYTSFIYVNGPNDDSAKPVQYQSLYSNENRVWVDYDKIPQSMKDAIVAIEDKRFWEHKGVDWKRTAGAVTTLFSKGSSYGGSTITQQLIKNVTGDKDVSLTRKVKEIFRALNLEQKYTKEEILAAYLNVVPFGSGSNGVQAAANLYFGKDIQDCDIAECAAIAGITQNPTKYSPLVHPEQNKERQQIVLKEMHGQGMITDAEYNTAMTKSEHMTFVGKQAENVVDDVPIWNWYVDTLFEDVKTGLMEHYNCSSDKAVDMIYHDGLKIYAAMDTDLQNIAETTFRSDKLFGSNTKMQAGYLAMDYSGRVLATVGSRGEKKSNRLFSLATDSKRQPGSTIKPLAVYGPAIDSGKYNYSSLINDNPLPNWFSDGSSGPKNWGPGNTSGKYWGPIPLTWALERSLNASAAQVGNAITPNLSFNFLKDKLGFTSLLPADNNRAPMAIGGLSEGVTVREMTAGFQMFANGGKYYKPYTFYHVDDHDGNVILDNRNQIATQAISSTTSSVMHHLLNNVVTGAHGTGRGAAISGWEVFGKTGTTNDEKDSWFIGGTPYAVAGIWTGYLTPAHLTNTTYAATTWKGIMASYLKNKEKLKFTYDSNVVSAKFCTVTGLLANEATDKDTQIGWYDKNHMPAVCDGVHAGSASSLASRPNESGTESVQSDVLSGGESHENPDTSSQAPTSSATPESRSSSAANSHPDKSQPGRSSAHSVPAVG
ncbi:transglycosylase domain-containing protein [Caproiciproducens faecalis]|uniref:Penicillin-binding protein 1A n=1 Tax=Caproiciproducens faecalis TaxID=2820301 RepID=A0ABS7DQ25_9FIRM|nr:transglycosylase domain-containing protein [Caproiciproducens faecalis]MBW7573403.1 transglycosylase domain-containing protein [Caproiciproducens faecalis]